MLKWKIKYYCDKTELSRSSVKKKSFHSPLHCLNSISLMRHIKIITLDVKLRRQFTSQPLKSNVCLRNTQKRWWCCRLEVKKAASLLSGAFSELLIPTSVRGTWPEREAGEKHLLVLDPVDQENPIFSIVELQVGLENQSCRLSQLVHLSAHCRLPSLSSPKSDTWIKAVLEEHNDSEIFSASGLSQIFFPSISNQSPAPSHTLRVQKLAHNDKSNQPTLCSRPWLWVPV